jgi:hypothetical protein
MARQVVSFIGVEKVKANFDKAMTLHEALLKSVLIETVDNKTIPMAQSLCPVDTGDLQKSIRREPPGDDVRESRKLFLVDVKAGGVVGESRGKLIEYAARVHEEHPTHSKYIQKAVLATGREIPGALKRTWLQTIDGKKL